MKFFEVCFLLTSLLVAGFANASDKKSSEAAVCENLLADILIDTDSMKIPTSKPKNLRELQENAAYVEKRYQTRLAELALLNEQLEAEIRDTGTSSPELNARVEHATKLVALVTDMLAEAKAKLGAASEPEVAPEDAEADLKKARAEVETKITRTPELAGHVRDYANFLYLRSVPKASAVTVLIGSPRMKPSAWDIKTGRRILQDLSARGYLILLDGHSSVTPEIIDAANGRAIALVSSPVKELEGKQVLEIRNRYLLMQTLIEQHRLVSTFSSTTGAALSLFGEVTNFLDERASGDFDRAKHWSKEAHKLGWNLGLKELPNVPASKNIARFVSDKRFPWIAKPVDILSIKFDQFQMSSLKQMSVYANRMLQGLSLVQGPEAVVFGSGQMSSKSSPLVYDVAYEMGKYGLGVATGGSGGAMLAANMGAYDAGGVSIGIPLSGSQKLESEKETFSEVQTKTVNAFEYTERIPWLLAGRKVIVNAPGGGGTLREVVLALISMSQEQDPSGVMLFLSKDYYGALVDMLTAMPIDPELLSRIAIVDNTIQLHEAMQAFHAAGKFDLAKYRRVAVPRSERRALPPELYGPKTWESSYTNDSKFSNDAEGSEEFWDLLHYPTSD